MTHRKSLTSQATTLLLVALLLAGQAIVANAQTEDRIAHLQRRLAEKGDFLLWDMAIPSKYPLRASEIVSRAMNRREVGRKHLTRLAHPRDKSGATLRRR